MGGPVRVIPGLFGAVKRRNDQARPGAGSDWMGPLACGAALAQRSPKTWCVKKLSCVALEGCVPQPQKALAQEVHIIVTESNGLTQNPELVSCERIAPRSVVQPLISFSLEDGLCCAATSD